MLAVMWSSIFCLEVYYPKNIKIKIQRIIILPAVWYGCEAWSLATRQEHRLRAFENRVLRKIVGPKRDEVMVAEETPSQAAFNMYSSLTTIRVIKSRRDWQGTWHIQQTRQLHTGVWKADLRGRATWKT